MRSIRILLADDHALVRAGFRALLLGIEDVNVVAEAADGREAWELIRSTRPDVALLHISMPGLNGLELTARVAAEQPTTRVIVLSMHLADHYVLRAIKAGAGGYLLKDASPGELDMTIRAVACGDTYITPKAARLVVDSLRNGETTATRLDTLTPRQREILQLIAEGHTTKAIATMLKISAKTVEAHRTQLMDRLDIHDLASVVRYAIQAGLVDRDQ